MLKLKTDKTSIKTAVRVFNEGGVLVFPTDTVYGIGCNPYDEHAVKKIYRIKNRNFQKSLPVLASSFEVATQIAKFDENSKKLAEKVWPGPLTLVLQIKDKRIEKSMKLSGKIAVRVPKNDWLQKALKEFKLIIGTSANISGQEPFIDPKNCSEKLAYDLFIDGGIITSGGESTVVEFTEKEMTIHREGVLSRNDLLELL